MGNPLGSITKHFENIKEPLRNCQETFRESEGIPWESLRNYEETFRIPQGFLLESLRNTQDNFRES